MRLNQVTIPALDVVESSAFYRRLGFRQIVRSPHYARFECPDGDSTFSLHAAEAPLAGPRTVLYFECEDLDARVAALQQIGVEFTQAPRDEPWLWREARLRDPAGNELCLYHAGVNRRHPPWRIDRA